LASITLRVIHVNRRCALLRLLARGGGKRDDVPGLRWRNGKPLFRFRFCGKSFVIRVNHSWGIARLCGGQVFIAVQGEVERTKGVAQAVALAGYARMVAQAVELLLPDYVNARGGNRADIAR